MSAVTTQMRAVCFAMCATVLGAGCVSDPGFMCSSDAQCVLSGISGRCSAPGYCSFANSSCPSQLRFGDHAGSLSGTCVSSGGGADLAGGDPCLPAPAAVAGALTAQCIVGRGLVAVVGANDDWSSAGFTDLDSVSAGPLAVGFSGNAAADRATLSAKFATRWDQTGLYVMVQVTDDVRQVVSSSLYRGDAVEVFVHPGNAPTGSYTGNDWQFIINPDNRVETLRGGNPVGTPAGVITGAKTTSGANWQMEIEVPWTIMGVQPSLGQLAAFDLIVDDLDNAASTTKPERTLTWKNAAPASCGECSASPCQPYCSTKCFGQLQLAGP